MATAVSKEPLFPVNLKITKANIKINAIKSVEVRGANISKFFFADNSDNTGA